MNKLFFNIDYDHVNLHAFEKTTRAYIGPITGVMISISDQVVTSVYVVDRSFIFSNDKIKTSIFPSDQYDADVCDNAEFHQQTISDAIQATIDNNLRS